MSLSYVKKNARKLLSFLAFGSFETLDSKLSHGTSQKVADVRHHIMKDSVEDCIFIIKKRQLPFFSGSIISVVGKTTVEIIELFKCTQKVP